jgi:hypothetical protein
MLRAAAGGGRGVGGTDAVPGRRCPVEVRSMARPRSWSDDDLRAAVAGANSYADVVRRLRLSHGGAAYITVRTRIEQLGLSVSHFVAAGGDAADRGHEAAATTRSLTSRGPSDEELSSAVMASRSLNQVFCTLRLQVGGSQWQRLRARIKALGLSTEHWERPLDGPPSRFAAALVVLRRHDIAALASTCTTRRELLQRVGLEPTSPTYRALAARLDEMGLPQSILAGRAAGGTRRRPLDDILVENSTWSNTSALRERLIEDGLKERRCEGCGLTTWRGGPIPLQLDHIDGDRTNNRLSNLRILCPNCHALTGTWCARNRGRGSSRDQK